MELFLTGDAFIVDNITICAAVVHNIPFTAFTDDFCMDFGNGNMGQGNIATFLSADGQFLLPGKWHRVPLVVRVSRGEHKQNTF